MGNRTSKEDGRPLLDEEDDDNGFQPIFNELKIVLIGSHHAGKNKVGNAIFEKKEFTFWSSFNRRYICKTRKVSGRQIHLYRVPGWNGDLSQSADTKQELKSCVHHSRPHAVLLVINVKAIPTRTSITTLEDLLTSQLWAHTIVMFTNAKRDIQNYITDQVLQNLLENCEQNYFVIQNDCDKITDTIEEFVVCKQEGLCFSPNEEPNVHEQLSNWIDIVQKIRSKIAFLSISKQNRLSKRKGLQSASIRKQLALKDAEINRLTQIVNDKEREIERLRSIIHKPLQEENKTLQEHNTTLQEENKTLQENNTTLQEENKTLQEHNTTLQEENKTLQENNTTLQEENKTLQEHNTTLQGENKTLQEHNTTLQGENKTLQEHNTTLQDENKTLQEHNTTLQDENKTLQEHNTTLQDENKTLQEHNTTLQGENTAQKKKIKALEVEKNAQKKVITVLQDENKTLNTKNKTLQDDIEAVNKKLKRYEEEKRTVSNHLHIFTRKPFAKKPNNEIQLQDVSSEHHSFTKQNWGTSLVDILEELSKEQLKRMKSIISMEGEVSSASMQDKDIYELAELLIQTWGKKQSIWKMQEIMRKIPRNDLMDMFEPFLET